VVVGARKAGAKMRGARSDHEVMSSDRVTHHRVTLIARGNDCLVRYRTARLRFSCRRAPPRGRSDHASTPSCQLAPRPPPRGGTRPAVRSLIALRREAIVQGAEKNYVRTRHGGSQRCSHFRAQSSLDRARVDLQAVRVAFGLRAASGKRPGGSWRCGRTTLRLGRVLGQRWRWRWHRCRLRWRSRRQSGRRWIRSRLRRRRFGSACGTLRG